MNNCPYRCEICEAPLQLACPECAEKTLEEARQVVLDLLACVPATNLTPYIRAHAMASKWLKKTEGA